MVCESKENVIYNNKTFIPLEIAVDMKFMARVYLNEYLIEMNLLL